MSTNGHRLQFGLRDLLLLLFAAAIFPGAWQLGPLFGTIVVVLVPVVWGIRIDRQRQRSGFAGALVGGIVGGVLTPVCATLFYIMVPASEDQYPALAAFVISLVTIPGSIGVGVIVGLCVWTILQGYLWLLETGARND